MNKHSKLLMVIVASLIILVTSIFFSDMRALFNQARYQELLETVEEEILSANIKIVALTKGTRGLAGASGVIFKREGQTYYALTANHVVTSETDLDQTTYVVLGHDTLDFSDVVEEKGFVMDVADYYKSLPSMSIEYTSKIHDLAVVSFTTDKEYPVVEISNESPMHKDMAVTMSNPHGERNKVTAGKIKSKEYVTFSDNEESTVDLVVEHTALISVGSSGSALLNEKLELVGIGSVAKFENQTRPF
ncbi:S1 family peptidase [Streptococcus suis]|uniref:Serine protease n=2 Tax=Bacteria TaxID=2 RepID=A0A9X4MN22_STRSU|nr:MULTISPECIES: serine protease [Streptococcus]MBY5011175.1 serine protease [Streptococcus suis]MDG4500112.1 serine protease [Streptococcus suis]MDG4512535.1 serine protease [Streptococcus suis]MDG4525741.1 serine protease [Streptococcus suis]ULL20455.1 serine protease [Streptococcus suis]